MISRSFFSLILFFFIVSSGDVWAEKVTKIHQDGSLELGSGKKVFLAGIKPLEESKPILASVLSGKDAEVEDEPLTVDSDQDAYVYIYTEELPMPYNPVDIPEIKKVMLNEMLLRLGAATVIEDGDFKMKEHFKELQSQAKKLGFGIWSYEPFGKKKKNSQDLNKTQ